MGALALRTKRTGRLVVVLAAATAVLAACQPMPASPPATILDVRLPDTVTAGEDLTVTARAHHPAGISTIGIVVRGPAGAYLQPARDSGLCSSWATSTQVNGAPGESEVTGSCTMPEFANNGTWTVQISVWPTGYQGASVTRTVEVVGGTDDYEGPVITALSPPPATVARGQTFPLALRIEDTNLAADTKTAPMNIFHESWTGSNEGMVFFCVDHTTTWVSPTVVDTSMSCTVKANQVPGRYLIDARSWGSEVADKLGFSSVYEASFVVT